MVSYAYRADGLRTYKNTNNVTTAYRYDGQMGIEDVETSPGTTTVTDYAIGARGIDGISINTNGTGATVSYPIYDAHGNSVLTLTKSGTNYYSTGNQRSYDAWGGVRIGNPNGDPHGQYCASLGHKADDETGFIYMRARYYEPSTARWLSPDPSRHGLNWYSYSANRPIDRCDSNGKVDEDYHKLAQELWQAGASLVGLGFLSFLLSALLIAYAIDILLPILLLPEVYAIAGGTTGNVALGSIALVVNLAKLIPSTKMIVAGIDLITASKYLDALGEDGLEYAAAYISAARSELGASNLVLGL